MSESDPDADAVVEVREQPGGTWRFAWCGPDSNGEPSSLPSNMPFPTAQEAAEAGRTAYPDLPVRLPERLRPAARRRRRLRRLLLLVGVAVLAHRLARRRHRAVPRPTPPAGPRGRSPLLWWAPHLRGRRVLAQSEPA